MVEMKLGNIDIRRDFGYAPFYVEGMFLMMQAGTASDYILCSGTSVKLKDMVEYVFEKLQIAKSKYSISADLYRPADIEDIFGDPSKAKEMLGWNYSLTYRDLLDRLLEEELQSGSR